MSTVSRNLKSNLRIIACAVFPLILWGCVSVARVEDLPKSSAQIAFDDIGKKGVRPDGQWNLETDFEYYFEVDAESDEKLHAAVMEAMKRSDYNIVRESKSDAAVIGERGLSLAEWKSVAGAYYRKKGRLYQVYIRSAITQDFTGGWRENRAKVIADRLCTELLACKVRISFADQ